jgi:predicted SnoaL-like aldol condensation-catalyzing enzyme
MKTILFTGFLVFFSSCFNNPNKEGLKMTLSKKEKVQALLKSLETGDPAPIAYINPEKYIQHNQQVPDGLKGFGEFLSQIPTGSIRVNTLRLIQQGDFVLAHSEYEFFGPKIGFDIFRFEDDLIVEHWDNLQEKVNTYASGRSQTDGPVLIQDRSKTEENQILCKSFVENILMGKRPDAIQDYFSGNSYDQHNPAVKDGLTGLGEALEAMANAGTPMEYSHNHFLLVEGNFAAAVSEGSFLGKPAAFYDLFRIENGKIVEHWDTVEFLIPPETAKNSNGKFNFPN